MEKKKKWIITGVILLVILIFGVGIYWYTRPKEVTSYTPEFETSQTKKESEKNTGNVEAGIQKKITYILRFLFIFRKLRKQSTHQN